MTANAETGSRRSGASTCEWPTVARRVGGGTTVSPRSWAWKRSPSDAAPGVAQAVLAGSTKLFDALDAEAIQALFHGAADAVEIGKSQTIQALRQLFLADDGESVRLLHVGGGLGEKAVGRDADRTVQHLANLVVDGLFDPAAKRDRIGLLLVAPNQVAGHFVDGQYGGHRGAGLYRSDDAVVEVHIGRGPRLHEDDVLAQLARLPDRCAGLDAVAFGVNAGGDAAGGVGQHRQHADRPAAQLRAELLLDGSKVGVEIDVERTQRHGKPRLRPGWQ